MTSEKVKLVVYSRYEGTTKIEQMEAQNWGEFVILKVPLEFFENYEPVNIEGVLAEIATLMPDKKVMVVPDTIVVELYGVREAIEDAADEQHGDTKLSFGVLGTQQDSEGCTATGELVSD